MNDWSVASTVFRANNYIFSSIVNTVLIAVLMMGPSTCIASCQTVDRDIVLNTVPATGIANHRSFAITVLSVLSTML